MGKLVKEGRLVGGKTSTKSKTIKADKLAPFREKGTFTEKEVNLMKTRLNSGKITMGDVVTILGDDGVRLTNEQRDKAVIWLRKRPGQLGYREQFVLAASDPSSSRPTWTGTSSIEARLVYFYQDGYYDSYEKKYKVIFNYPVYRMERLDSSFEYYVKGGEINIVG